MCVGQKAGAQGYSQLGTYEHHDGKASTVFKAGLGEGQGQAPHLGEGLLCNRADLCLLSLVVSYVAWCMRVHHYIMIRHTARLHYHVH